MAQDIHLDLSFSQAGAGKPVVILHGLFGSKRNWGAIAKHLSRDRRVLCLDLRNHGSSPWDPAMTYGAMAADVAAFIRGHALKDVTLIGHSMGGKAAMALALAHPELIARLAVVDIAPAASPGTFIHYVEALKAMDLSRVKSRKDADRLLAPVEAEPGIRTFLLQNLESAGEGYRWRVNLEALAANMADLLDWPEPDYGQSYAGPALFLAGGASDYIGPHHHGDIARLFPKAHIKVLPGIGHWIHAQAPDLFLKHIETFITKT